jgi:putative ABC transport system permease protein
MEYLPVSPRLLAPICIAVVVLLLMLAIGKVPIRYNLRNLVVRWRITVLTALAFTLVIAILTVMLAFVNGMMRLTEGSGQPGNVVVLSDGATDELMSNLSASETSDVDQHPLVLRNDRGQRLCSRELYIVANQAIPGAEEQAKQRRFVQIRGIDEPALTAKVHGLDLHEGGAWFSPAGVQPYDWTEPGGAKYSIEVIQAVLGAGIAREFGKDVGKETLELGDLFELGPRKWIVVGILQSAGSTFDSEVWAKRQLVGPMFGKENYTTLVMRTAKREDARALAEDLTTNFKKSAVYAQTETDYYEKLNTTNQQFMFSIMVVAIIMAVGGVFGVMNTMFAAISQRINDIAVLRIIGFSRWQVLVSFFLESMVIALAGGLLGCALGSLADGWSASSIVSGGGGGGKSIMLKLSVDANVLATGLVFTLIMGAVGGLLPSLSAMRLKPLESLR